MGTPTKSTKPIKPTAARRTPHPPEGRRNPRFSSKHAARPSPHPLTATPKGSPMTRDEGPATMSNGAADPRRALPIALDWNSDGTIGRITINGEYWAAVEWSEPRQCWCIEGAEGACLGHASHIQGQARSKKAAVALAREMIRDGRMPAPDELAREARARREKRRQQPAQIRKREERRQRDAAWFAAIGAKDDAERLDRAELLVVEALAEAFDFADPELWKSNSWAAMRPRLSGLARCEVGLSHRSGECRHCRDRICWRL